MPSLTIGSAKEVYLYKQDSFSSVPEEQINNSIRLKLHATTGYSTSRSASATAQPVSDASDRTDHVTNNGTILRLAGVIADHVNPFRIDRSERTSIDYVEEINALMDNRSLVTVVFPSLGLHQNCYITSFTSSRRTDTGLGTEVDLTIQKLLIAEVADIKQVRVLDQDITATGKDSGSVSTTASDLNVLENLKDNSFKVKVEQGKINGQ